MRRFKYDVPDYAIKDMCTISRNSINTVMEYPIFEGQKTENKIILMIYDAKNDHPCGL